MAKDVKTSQDQLKKLLEAVEYAIKAKDDAAATMAEKDNDEAAMSAVQDFFGAFKYVEEEFKAYNDIRTEELEAIEASIAKGEGTGLWGNLLRTEGYRFKK